RRSRSRQTSGVEAPEFWRIRLYDGTATRRTVARGASVTARGACLLLCVHIWRLVGSIEIRRAKTAGDPAVFGGSQLDPPPQGDGERNLPHLSRQARRAVLRAAVPRRIAPAQHLPGPVGGAGRRGADAPCANASRAGRRAPLATALEAASIHRPA